MTSAASDFEWRIELPDRRAHALGSARPRARLLIESEARGEETLSIPASVGRVLLSRKRSGDLKPLSRAELLYNLDQTSRKLASARVASLVDRRDYSVKELSDKLRQDGYREEVVDDCVRRARDAGLVDDARFADVFIRTKVSAGWGARRIERELSHRGIEASELPGWPYEYLDPDDERERARELAERHHVSGKNQLQKMVRYLVGRGFSMGDAYDAARAVVGERR